MKEEDAEGQSWKEDPSRTSGGSSPQPSRSNSGEYRKRTWKPSRVCHLEAAAVAEMDGQLSVGWRASGRSGSRGGFLRKQEEGLFSSGPPLQTGSFNTFAHFSTDVYV